jgi:co-chaperonin GroES (HSP10)
MPRVQIKQVDVSGLIESFPILPYASRLYVIEKEVERVGHLYVPETAKDKEMQTNEGWVIATGPDVDFCQPGDIVYYARYSGAWCTLNEIKYRVMNEEDLLGKYDDMKGDPYAGQDQQDG